MKYREKFHKCIKDRLDGQNLASVAREIGISSSILHDWVKGGRFPNPNNLDSLKKLANYLGYETIDEIIYGSQVKTVLSSVSFEDNVSWSPSPPF